MRSLFIATIVLAVAAAGGLKDLSATAPQPDAVSGHIIYSTSCIRCHGIDGKGEGQMKFTPPAADLTSPTVQGKLDARLFKTVHDGKANTAMGAWREALSDDEIWDVLAYVRTLAPRE
jgi:mono/diheme cytochrome c family protein